jgi:hypothetical protein
LHGFIVQSIEPGSTVVTDGPQAYHEMEGYVHELPNQVNRPMPNTCCRGCIGSFPLANAGCWALHHAIA